MGQQINVEIILEKDFTQTPNKPLSGIQELSWDASGVWSKCIKNKSGWSINWDLFEKTHGISKQRRINALKELKDKRYCVEKTYMDGKTHCYVYYFSKLPMSEELVEYLLETPYEQIPNDLDVQTIQKILKVWISQSSKRDLVNEIAKSTPYINNIITNNTNLKILNEKQAEINFRSVEQENSFNLYNHDSHDTCEHDSNNTLTISEKINKHDNMENFGGDTKLHKTSNCVTIPKRAKSTKCNKGLDADGNVTKNKMEVHKAQGEVPLSNILESTSGKKLSNQTVTEQEINRAQKVANETKQLVTDLKFENAKAAIRKNTKTKRKDKISTLVKKDFSGDLQNAMLNYVDFFIESGKKMLEGNYRALVQKLNELSKGDEKKKLEIVNNSLRNCWLDFYDIKPQVKQNKKSSNTPQFQFEETNAVEDDDSCEAATDEFGNVLLF